MVKCAAARANFACGQFDETILRGIEEACEEVIDGKLHDQFQLDVFQGGAGTSTNMNINEVIANRALELMRHHKGEYSYCDPHDHVNASQSTNDRGCRRQRRPGGLQVWTGGRRSTARRVPQTKKLAMLVGEQVANIGSQDMNDEVWLKLARRVSDLAAMPEVNGVVITHGTDSIEETAYFLNLVVKTRKPDRRRRKRQHDTGCRRHGRETCEQWHRLRLQRLFEEY